jgi:hypothetical protein
MKQWQAPRRFLPGLPCCADLLLLLHASGS